MWVTWHPFAVTKWSKLCTGEELGSAVEEHQDEILGDRDIDEDLVELVADRLWLIVLSSRQEELMMSKYYLGKIRELATQEAAP